MSRNFRPILRMMITGIPDNWPLASLRKLLILKDARTRLRFGIPIPPKERGANLARPPVKEVPSEMKLLMTD